MNLSRTILAKAAFCSALLAGPAFAQMACPGAVGLPSPYGQAESTAVFEKLASASRSVEASTLSEGVWKIQTQPGPEFVVRTPGETADVEFEAYASEVVRATVPGAQLYVRLLTESERSLLAARLVKPAERKLRASLMQGPASIAPLVRQDQSNPRDQLVMYSLVRGAGGDAAALASLVQEFGEAAIVRAEGIEPEAFVREVLSKKAREEISSLFVVRLLVGSPDFHFRNWIFAGGHAIGVDAAYFQFATGLDGQFDPLRGLVNRGDPNGLRFYVEEAPINLWQAIAGWDQATLFGFAAKAGYTTDRHEIARTLRLRDRFLGLAQTAGRWRGSRR